MSHSHERGHSHNHESSAGSSKLVKTLVAELEHRGIVTEQELDAKVEAYLLHAHPGNGQRVIARAWVDPEFRARLLQEPNAAMESLDIDFSHWANVAMRVVENTPEQHNVIVCTLCSCYPVALLGPSPTWYKSEAYRSAVVRDPRAVLAEFGYTLPDSTKITVWDSTADVRYLVLPMRPPSTEKLSEEELAARVTRNGMIGTAAF